MLGNIFQIKIGRLLLIVEKCYAYRIIRTSFWVANLQLLASNLKKTLTVSIPSFVGISFYSKVVVSQTEFFNSLPLSNLIGKS